MVIAQLKMKLLAYKVTLFLHCIVDVDVLKIFNSFQFDSPDNKNDLAKKDLRSGVKSQTYSSRYEAKILQTFDNFIIG